MKSILIGLAVVIAGAWCLTAFGTLIGLAVNVTDPGDGLPFEWFTWILIAPALALGAVIVLALLWAIGEKVSGQ